MIQNSTFYAALANRRQPGMPGVFPVSETVRYEPGTPAHLGDMHSVAQAPPAPLPSAEDPSCQGFHPHIRKASLEKGAALKVEEGCTHLNTAICRTRRLLGPSAADFTHVAFSPDFFLFFFFFIFLFCGSFQGNSPARHGPCLLGRCLRSERSSTCQERASCLIQTLRGRGCQRDISAVPGAFVTSCFGCSASAASPHKVLEELFLFF